MAERSGLSHIGKYMLIAVLYRCVFIRGGVGGAVKSSLSCPQLMRPVMRKGLGQVNAQKFSSISENWFV